MMGRSFFYSSIFHHKTSEEKHVTYYPPRHVQTEWNSIERLRRRADVSLNETGLAQCTFYQQNCPSVGLS